MAEVGKRFDLAGGVAFEGELEVTRGDAAAIVADADEGDPTVFGFDGDACAACVDRVVEQLANDGDRALDDLSRGDARGHFGEQYPD